MKLLTEIKLILPAARINLLVMLLLPPSRILLPLFVPGRSYSDCQRSCPNLTLHFRDNEDGSDNYR